MCWMCVEVIIGQLENAISELKRMEYHHENDSGIFVLNMPYIHPPQPQKVEWEQPCPGHSNPADLSAGSIPS